MPTIKFTKENKEISVPEGANLRSEAIKAGINVHQGVNGIGAGVNKIVNCKGWGHCATCRVNITKGTDQASEMGWWEKMRLTFCLTFIGNEEKMRLSCCTKVEGDMEVETGPEVNLFGENFFS